ncbi:MAG: outer membrane protein assembly factor BamA [Gammaproteobacteria bacterium]|nr:MAG: outer membrane protein assembly factor BamA [Gammaproteobacteria bacterium]
MKLLARLIVLVFFYTPFVVFSEDIVVKDIRVKGLTRISAGTVFNYLPIKVGDTLTKKKAQDATRALFKTGFFRDIRLTRDGNILTVVVKERPSIDNIEIEGSKDIGKDDLKKSLKDVGLSEGRIFNRSLLDNVEAELKRQYFSRGRYSVQIDTTVTPMERNRVGIKIEIREGKVAKIRGINIVGNNAYSDKKILKELSLSEPGFTTFFSGNDKYSKEKLIGDSEEIRNLYQNNGYLEFAIDSTQVSISPDKESMYITINLSEGKIYRVANYKLSGKLVLPEEEIREMITFKSGDIFSRKSITDITKSITDALGDKGYAFANVNPIPDVDKEKGEVSFTFFVDPGKRVYVRRVNFSGNTVTRDEVLRREMRQLEGSWFSPERVKRSRVRLQRLGFFDEINVETPQVPGTSDQVDINVSVKERPTGNLLFGVGYSDVDGALINGSVTETNLFGTGKNLSLRFDNSRSNRRLNLSYVNPYYTQSGISRGFSVYSTKVDSALANTAAYLLSTSGAGVTFGFPTSENQSLRTGLAYETTDVSVTTAGAQVAQDFVSRYGEENAIFRATLGWAYNSFNSALFPTSGGLQRITMETTFPGSDIDFTKTTYETALYLPVYKSAAFRTRLELGYGTGGGDTESLPFYKNYFAGGSRTVRGYRSRSLGPIDPVTNNPIGGNRRILGNLELFFPFPGTGADNNAMRLSLFVDGGMVYGEGQDVDLGTVRYSGGFAFNWFSPIGPLAFSYATPFNAEPDDDIERFQFTIGVPFR